MPFLDLDDSLTFHAWPKVYIYFVLAAALLLLTFCSASAWDRFSAAFVRKTTLSEAVTGDAENNSGNVNNDQLLEPTMAKEHTPLEFLLSDIDTFNATSPSGELVEIDEAISSITHVNLADLPQASDR